MKARLLILLLLAQALSTGASAASYVIEIKNIAFGAAPQRLVVGDTVVFKNDDIFRHTATARYGAFDLVIEPGGQAAATLTTAGTIDVYCRLHPTMKLQLRINKSSKATTNG